MSPPPRTSLRQRRRQAAGLLGTAGAADLRPATGEELQGLAAGIRGSSSHPSPSESEHDGGESSRSSPVPRHAHGLAALANRGPRHRRAVAVLLTALAHLVGMPG